MDRPHDGSIVALREECFLLCSVDNHGRSVGKNRRCWHQTLTKPDLTRQTEQLPACLSTLLSDAKFAFHLVCVCVNGVSRFRSH